MIYLITFALFFIFIRPLKLTEFQEFKVGFPGIKNFQWKNLIDGGKSNSTLNIPVLSKTVNVVKYSYGGIQNVTKTTTQRIDPLHVREETRLVGSYPHRLDIDYIKFDSQEDLQKAEDNIKSSYGKNDKLRYYKSKLEYLIFQYDTSNPNISVNSRLQFFIKTLRLKSQEHLHLKKDKFVAIISFALFFLLLFNLNNLVSALWEGLSGYGYSIFSANLLVPLILSAILTITILAYSKKLNYVENSTYDVPAVLILILSLIITILAKLGFYIGNRFDLIHFAIFDVIQNLLIWAILVAIVHFLFYRRTLKEIKD